MEKEEMNNRLRAIHKMGAMKLLSAYNRLCPACRRKSIMAVRRGGDALKNVVNTYCPSCKEMLGGLQ